MLPQKQNLFIFAWKKKLVYSSSRLVNNRLIIKGLSDQIFFFCQYLWQRNLHEPSNIQVGHLSKVRLKICAHIWQLQGTCLSIYHMVHAKPFITGKVHKYISKVHVWRKIACAQGLSAQVRLLPSCLGNQYFLLGVSNGNTKRKRYAFYSKLTK